MVVVQKQNNMKNGPFKLRSGNKPSMALLSGKESPMKQTANRDKPKTSLTDKIAKGAKSLFDITPLGVITNKIKNSRKKLNAQKVAKEAVKGAVAGAAREMMSESLLSTAPSIYTPDELKKIRKPHWTDKYENDDQQMRPDKPKRNIMRPEESKRNIKKNKKNTAQPRRAN